MAASASPPPQPPPADTPQTGPNNTPAIVALGIGGIGVAVGGIFGVLALTKKSSLDGVCDANKACPASAQSDINALGTNATISTVGFVVGAIGLAAGAIVLLTSGKGGTSGSAWLGPGSAGVRGEFQ
jgi:LPXTG-motif cell wall-anchored protein